MIKQKQEHNSIIVDSVTKDVLVLYCLETCWLFSRNIHQLFCFLLQQTTKYTHFRMNKQTRNEPTPISESICKRHPHPIIKRVTSGIAQYLYIHILTPFRMNGSIVAVFYLRSHYTILVSYYHRNNAYLIISNIAGYALSVEYSTTN